MIKEVHLIIYIIYRGSGERNRRSTQKGERRRAKGERRKGTGDRGKAKGERRKGKGVMENCLHACAEIYGKGELEEEDGGEAVLEFKVHGLVMPNLHAEP